MEKPILRCKKCLTEFHFQKNRNWFGRTFLSFLPVRVYFCAKCLKNRYLFITKKQAAKYKRIW